ncbi:DUF6300 family protein [Streptomyces sp. AM6-12]|uniref:DUF6300 family protein n=1 Tax=Streptomyces sp. AM6-12 TaxID=3345149 RepID=UPI00379CCDC4
MTAPGAGDEVIHVRVGATPPCARCESPALLLVRFPHSWAGADGQRLRGLRESTLCAVCDRGRTETEALLRLLTTCGELDAVCSGFAGGLVAAWVESLRRERVDLELLADEHGRWRRGDL